MPQMLGSPPPRTGSPGPFGPGTPEDGWGTEQVKTEQVTYDQTTSCVLAWSPAWALTWALEWEPLYGIITLEKELGHTSLSPALCFTEKSPKRLPKESPERDHQSPERARPGVSKESEKSPKVRCSTLFGLFWDSGARSFGTLHGPLSETLSGLFSDSSEGC